MADIDSNIIDNNIDIESPIITGNNNNCNINNSYVAVSNNDNVEDNVDITNNDDVDDNTDIDANANVYVGNNNRQCTIVDGIVYISDIIDDF